MGVKVKTCERLHPAFNTTGKTGEVPLKEDRKEKKVLPL
jgi:hypothetical protein